MTITLRTIPLQRSIHFTKILLAFLRHEASDPQQHDIFRTKRTLQYFKPNFLTILTVQ